MRKMSLVILCLALLPAATGAQTLNTPSERPSFLMEAMHPSYEGDDAAVSSGAYILTGRVPVSPTASVRFDLPFSYLRESYSPDITETSSSIGNPFLGLELQQSAGMDIAFGLRPAMADETELANLYAAFADLSRWEAFVPNLWTISGQARWHRTTPTGLSWEINAGPTLWLPQNDTGDNELWAEYGAGIGYSGQSYRLAVRSKGRLWLSQDGLSFDQRTNHQVGLFADFGSGNMRPGAQLLLPVDRNSENETTWGLSLQYTLK